MRTHWLVCVLAVLSLLGAVALAAAEEAQGPPAVEVHGFLLTRYYVNTTVYATTDRTGAITNEQDDSWVEWERISLSAKARLTNGKEAYAEVYIHPWSANSDPSFLYLESFYVDIPAGPGAKFRIGKGRNQAFGIVPSGASRKTSNYSPLSETFTMDRVLGIQYMQQRGDDSFNFGILNAQRPGSRVIGLAADGQLDLFVPGVSTLPGVSHLTDRDTPADRSGELEVSARYGHQYPELNVGLSGRLGAMDGQDAAYLASKFPTYNGTNRTRLRYGLDATYKDAPWYGTAQYYVGLTGGIRESGWEILLGLEPSRQAKACCWLAPVCKGLYVRYGDYDVGVPQVDTNTMTWDRQQLAVSYVLPLSTDLLPEAKWLQFEYERNEEDAPAGWDEIPNDLFFVELFSAF